MKKPRKQDQIAEGALRFLSRHPWEALSLPALAQETGVSLAQIETHAATPTDLIPLIVAFIDRSVAAQCEPDEQASFEDNLFDLWMTRFEILQKRRKGVLALAGPCRHVPALAWAMFQAQKKSCVALLGALDPKRKSLTDSVRILAFLIAYQKVFCRWENDESPDLALTMAALGLATQKCKNIRLYPSQECNAS